MQNGYNLVFNASFGTPTRENGYINTHGCRAVGIDGVDVTDYNFFCGIAVPAQNAASMGYIVSNTVSVVNAYTLGYWQSGTMGANLKGKTGKYNLGLGTGTSGENVSYLIYDMWLE